MRSFSRLLSCECTRSSRSHWRQSSRKMKRPNSLPSPVRILESASFQRTPQRPETERMPWRTSNERIRWTCRLRSFFNCVRRERRLASSSSIVGSRTGRQTDLSQSKYAFASTSTRSVTTGWPRRETRKLDGSRIVV